MNISEKKILASELLKVAKDLVAYNVGTVKVESIKYGEICFACELKFDKDSSLSEVINGLNSVWHHKMDVIQMKLDHGGLLDYDTGWTRVEIKNNAIVVRMYYSDQFEIEEAKKALKEIGVR